MYFVKVIVLPGRFNLKGTRLAVSLGKFALTTKIDIIKTSSTLNQYILCRSGGTGRRARFRV